MGMLKIGRESHPNRRGHSDSLVQRVHVRKPSIQRFTTFYVLQIGHRALCRQADNRTHVSALVLSRQCNVMPSAPGARAVLASAFLIASLIVATARAVYADSVIQKCAKEWTLGL
jgi:hypothetical protein